MADDLKDAIMQSAEGPKQASTDGVNTQQHSLADRTAADRYLASKQAMASKSLGVRFAEIVPPAGP